jgi:hypothetical protein
VFGAWTALPSARPGTNDSPVVRIPAEGLAQPLDFELLGVDAPLRIAGIERKAEVAIGPGAVVLRGAGRPNRNAPPETPKPRTHAGEELVRLEHVRRRFRTRAETVNAVAGVTHHRDRHARRPRRTRSGRRRGAARHRLNFVTTLIAAVSTHMTKGTPIPNGRNARPDVAV